MTRTRVTLAVTAAVAGVVLGAGCSGSDAEPQTVPTPTPSTLTPSTRTPTVQPTTDPTTPTGPEEPVIPDAARDPGRAGAEAFVRYSIDLLNYAANTGDTTALRDAAAKECDGCERYLALYERVYRDGGWIHGGRWSPSAAFANSQPDGFVVTAQVSASATRYKRNADDSVHFSSGGNYSLVFTVSRRGRAWSIMNLEGDDQ